MRAVAAHEFGPPAVLAESELPLPEPRSGEVSIDVAYAGVGFVDTLLRSGAYPLPLPLVPGIEVTGTVRAAGEGVEGLRPGTAVAALLNDFGRATRAGGYAEVAIAHRSMVAELPADADLPAVTAVVSNGAAAWVALHRIARLEASDRVLVLGASGGIGATAARLAALHPAARVIGVVGHDPSRAPRECTEAIVAAELGDQLDLLTDDGLVDVVFDPVGGSARAEAFAHLAPFGRHLILGNASGEDPPLSGDDAWEGTKLLAGLSVGAVAHEHPALLAEALAAVTALVTRGVLAEPPPTIVPLGEAGATHAKIEERSAPAKTVLAVGAAG